MTAVCTVMEDGKLMWVALPDEWQEANNVKEGDVLEVITDVKGQITFSKPIAEEGAERINRLEN